MAENRELALVLKLVADQFQSELKNSQGALGQFNNFIKDWKTQLVAAGTALFAVAKSTANYGDELFKTAQKVGIQVEALAGLQHAAQLADVDHQQLQLGLQGLSRAMIDAAQGAGEGMEAFRRVGVSATDAQGRVRPMQDVLLDLADVFARSQDGAGKTEVAMKLLGKSGVEMIPFLNQGKAGIRELMDEARRLGLVMSEDDAKAAEAFNDELTRLQAALKGMTLAVGRELIPTMTQLIELFRNLGVGGGVGAGVSFLHTQFVALNTLLKELQANSQFLFGTGKDALNLDQLRAKIAEIEGEAKRKLFEFRQPGVLTPAAPADGGAGGSAGNKTTIAAVADQEKLGKALLDIHLANNRAIDLQIDRQLQREKEDGDFQERQGKVIVESTALEVRMREAARQEEQQGLVENLQAWRAYYDQVGGSAEFRYTKELDLVRATLAQQTLLTQEDSARLLLAWQNHDEQLATQILNRTTLTEQQRETIMLRTMANVEAANQLASDDVVAGWARGMQNYVQTTESGFDMASDMARRTAQAVEQSFRLFFFDLFEGKVNSLKDVLQGFLGFVKQIAAQVASQLAVSFILKSFTGEGGGGFLDFFSGLFGGDKSGPSVQPAGLFGRAATGGEFVRKYAAGGPVLGFGNLDTIPALLTPGEYVLSRRDVSDIKQGIVGQASAPTNVTVNVIGAPQDSTASVDVRRTTDSMVIDVLLRHQRDLRPLFGGA